MGHAARLVAVAEDVLGGPLPVGVRAWDGSRAGPADAPEVVLRARRAMRHVLWRPGELGLARAYVSGDLDVAGDLKDGLRRARTGRLRHPWRVGRSSSPASRRT